jgi:hypothetical protein
MLHFPWQILCNNVRLRGFMVVTMKIIILWNVTSCSPVEDRIHCPEDSISFMHRFCINKAIGFNIVVLRGKNKIDSWLFM